MCAVFNEILAGRYNRFLQKLFVLKGPPPTPQLASEIIPTFSLFAGVENRVLENWQRFGATINLAAGGAGNISKWRFRNPNKALIAVFEKVVISNNNAAATLYTVQVAGAITSDLGTPQTTSNQQLDLRGQAAANLLPSFENNTATLLSGIAVFNGLVASNASQDIILFEDHELVLANGNIGGSALHIQANTANSNLLASVIWRERALEESEQAFG